MSETVKAIRFYQTGESDVLRVDEIPLSQLKKNEVLVRVQAVALSRMDLMWRAGSYFEEPEFPAEIGYDAAGVVVSVGPEVQTLKLGDRVSTFPALSLASR
jgi:NADPH:quinone reductase-like Zn-dependent oxidoreductase